MKITKLTIAFFLLLLLSTTITNAQVGIGTVTPDASSQLDVNSTNKGFLPPRMTSAERSAIASPAAGLMVYQTDENTGNYIYNGTSWVLLSSVNYGDIKTGIQSTDHNGWIKLDGRLLSTLSTSQQTQATSLGILTNLPDATNAYLVQNGGALGTVSGSNTKTIAQTDLPNVSLSGVTVGANDGSHNHSITSIRGSDSNVSGGSNFKYNVSGPSTTTTFYTTNSTHSHTVYIPSLNGGVAQTSFDVTPQSLSVNTFIYLGY